MVSTRALKDTGERDYWNQHVEKPQAFYVEKTFLQLRNELVSYLERIRKNESKIIKKGFFRTIYLNDIESKKVLEKISDLFQLENNKQNSLLLGNLYSSIKRNRMKLTQIIETLQVLK